MRYLWNFDIVNASGPVEDAENKICFFDRKSDLYSYLIFNIDMSSQLESYQKELIDQAMSVGALKFGEFTLKSGRYAKLSPFAIYKMTWPTDVVPSVSPHTFSMLVS